MISINDNNMDEELQEYYINIVQSKKNIRFCKQFINDLFVSSGGEKMKYNEKQIYQIGPNLKFNRDIQFITEEYFSLKHENMVNAMNKKLSESEWKDHELMRNFKPECLIQVGQKLESIPDLEKLQGDRVMRNYLIEDGRICIIYIWTVYNTVCKKQLKFLNDLYEKNHVWEGTVKLISINSELNRDISKKFIKSLNLMKMDHLYIDSVKYPNHPLLNLVSKIGYPLCIMVNNDNIIDFCGSLYDIDLQKTVSALLHRELVSSSNITANMGLSLSDRKILKEILSNLRNNCDLFKNNLKAPHLCGATLKINKIYTASSSHHFNRVKESNVSLKKNIKEEKKNSNSMNIKRFFTKASKSETSSRYGEKESEKSNCDVSCELQYYCHQDDDDLFQNLFQGIEQIPKINIQRQFIETVEIPSARVNSLCSMCNKAVLTYYNVEIKEQDENSHYLNISCESYNDSNIIVSHQYYCFKCAIHLCKNCGDHLSDLNFPNQVHNHHLFYLHNNNRLFSKYILSYNFQNNYDFDFKYYQENTKTPKYINDIKNHYQVSCDACRSFPITTNRWKCCNCIFKNICDNCKCGAEDEKNPNHQMILKNLEIQGCNGVNHVFMKVVFDSFVY
jgi:hypothetical protein